MSGPQWHPPQSNNAGQQYSSPPAPNWPPSTPPGMWPSPPPPWAASGPVPPPPPKRHRRPLIVAALITAAVITAVIVGITLKPAGHRGAAASSASATTTSPEAPARTYRPNPAAVLPDSDTVRRVTLLDVKPVDNTVDTALIGDSLTTPPNCALADLPATNSVWAQSLSTADKQLWTEIGDHPGGSAAGMALAVFDTISAAAESLKTVTAAVKGCTTYTAPANDPSMPPDTWVVGDVVSVADSISWTDTEQVGAHSWKCGHTYRIAANIAATALVCSPNPADNPARLADTMIAAATKN